MYTLTNHFVAYFCLRMAPRRHRNVAIMFHLVFFLQQTVLVQINWSNMFIFCYIALANQDVEKKKHDGETDTRVFWIFVFVFFLIVFLSFGLDFHFSAWKLVANDNLKSLRMCFVPSSFALRTFFRRSVV